MGQEGTKGGTLGTVRRCLGLARPILGRREDLLPPAPLGVEKPPGLRSGKGHSLKAKQGRARGYVRTPRSSHTPTRIHPDPQTDADTPMYKHTDTTSTAWTHTGAHPRSLTLRG